MNQPNSGFAGVLSELKRRRVFRVAAAYVVVAWLVIRIAETVFPYLHLPGWTVTFVTVLAVLGLPVALLLARAFNIASEGIGRPGAALRRATWQLSGRRELCRMQSSFSGAARARVLRSFVSHEGS